MTYQEEAYDSGRHLGMEGVEHVAGSAEAYCDCERERISLVNEPRIRELHAHGCHLAEREIMLKERLRHAAPPGFVRQRRHAAAYYWGIGIALALAAFFFSIIGFAPYRLGWTGYLYCLGIALVTPFIVEEFLDAWHSERRRLYKAMVTGVFLSAVVGGALLAEIRGELLARETEQQEAAVVIEGSAPARAVPEASFYESTRGLLRAMMILFALAMDIGAGIAIHRARAIGAVSGEDADTLLLELGDVRMQLGAAAAEITALTNAPAEFVARFWRDFYRSMLTQTARKAITKIGLSLLCLCILMGRHASAQNPMNLVVAVDLSASEAVKTDGGRTGLSRNIEGVGKLLAMVAAGTRISVIGITDNSFTSPRILLSAEVSPDPGFFGERLIAARRDLLRTWRERAVRLKPDARGSDIFGALLLAAELFRRGPPGSRNVLALYSDMRHVTPILDLETPPVIPVKSTLKTAAEHGLVADLAGVAVYAAGTATPGRRIEEWKSLRQFWSAYFHGAGANIGGYSILWEPPGCLERTVSR
ncbi:MAG: hypothetical protein ABSH32_22365 [Bryobacteraceae bacterium]